MILLQAVRIDKSFGAHRVLNNVNLIIQEGERSGIVGVNGAGKSTLLKIITGALSPDAGEVIKAKDLSVSYMAQDGGLESGQSIWNEMLSAFTHLICIEKQLRNMEKRMGDPAVVADGKEYRQLLRDYDNLSSEFKNKGGFEYEANIRGVLHGLNFRDMDYNTPVNILSGGQKTRLALARCLLGAPDLLILDEPTNYLDMDNLTWLEQYLQSYRGAVLAVSHDRYFLDTLAKVIYDLDKNGITRYTGNYTSFVRQKAELQEQQLKAYKKQQEEIGRMEEFIRRNMAAKDTTGRAQSRLKTLEKMERVTRPEKEHRVKVSFHVERPSGREVLKVRELTIGYPGAALATGLNFDIEKGERVVLIGPNGTGKSTLLKTIAGLLPPLAGHIRQGSLVQIGYYEQEHQGLHRDKDVLHELWDRYPHMNELDIRKALGGFLFSGDDVNKSVAGLSGGEKSRLALAALMLRKANFLLLDEPTNHLDLPGKEALEDALAGYPGTILFVSHDRYFINKVASRVLELSHGSVNSYQGNYDYYQNKKPRLPGAAKSGPDRPADSEEKKQKQYLQKKEEDRQKRKHLREIASLEQSIADQESLIVRLEKELEQPEVYLDYQACQQRQSELEKVRAVLQDNMEKWLALVEAEQIRT
ncbi:ABC-F family ATP-binding cassette domain-containing protein [Pelotomaculum terephthalicicum JT]|uniref:ABC-F family ATP-binding cassette domain-containing protein n=1 Tax=Pelotomaculum terephthalicicum TaxID=206393 RepID=UPI001F04AB22|nr:ABC-F family ATP-binding cassette domain-containing protein [Pelotomaculum terephthalicicum]MCG9966835.1 ABC-F family ATP-binding cassette domain-containing protein [Pelotomaculum terephthalicicum JT]